MELLPCVPEILTFIFMNIEPLFFVASLALTKQLKTQKFKAREYESGSIAGAHLSSAGGLWQFVKATIPYTHSISPEVTFHFGIQKMNAFL